MSAPTTAQELQYQSFTEIAAPNIDAFLLVSVHEKGLVENFGRYKRGVARSVSYGLISLSTAVIIRTVRRNFN
jgi:hypothetical protein